MTEQTPLGRMIGYCGHLGKLYLDMRLRQSKYNVTPVQSHTLLYLSKICGEREVMQRDLERELHLKASTVNGIVDRLEEKGFIAAHCQMVTYFAYNIPNYKGYLKSILDGFFFAHQQVRNEFENLAKNQEQKERVEIKGFHNN